MTASAHASPPLCNLTRGRMPAGITTASARGGLAQGGIDPRRNSIQAGSDTHPCFVKMYGDCRTSNVLADATP